MSKAAVRACLVVTILLALPACSGSSPAGSTSTSATGADTPSTESTSGVEQPLPPRAGNPGISVASLPVGGESAGLSGGDGLQCVRVNWVLSTSGDPLPGGVAVEVTGAAFDPGTYRPADGGCQGPPCIGYLFHGSERACDLSIKPKVAAETALSDSQDVGVTLEGRVRCTDKNSATCKAFVGTVNGQPQTIRIPLPTSPTPPTSPTAPSAPNSAPGPSPGSGGTTPPQAPSSSPRA